MVLVLVAKRVLLVVLVPAQATAVSLLSEAVLAVLVLVLVEP